ncbi:hypothetical protein CJ030_MR8G019420 [Morella rubra]|uniref:Uncharacterized protein n=1 Tax=Morella rubra TaxID=262757 RepID=A0A6A1USJ0_9ROSI|nr:hypothetical protein CJ030_MR8G019420 [Morella rubra]
MVRGKHARHSLADADQLVSVEEYRQLNLGRSVQMEREARPLELQGLNFEGRTIHDVIHSRGWDPITVQSGTISLPVVRAFYDSYDVMVRDVTVTFSAQRIAEFLGLPRPEGPAIPELEDLAPLEPFDLFLALHRERGECAGSAAHTYNIDPRKRTTESTFERARLMVRLVRGVPMDLPGYMFKLAREAADSVDKDSLPFGLLITVCCPTYPGEDRQKLRGVIDANTLARSRAAIRQGLCPIPGALPCFGAEPPAWATRAVGQTTGAVRCDPGDVRGPAGAAGCDLHHSDCTDRTAHCYGVGGRLRPGGFPQCTGERGEVKRRREKVERDEIRRFVALDAWKSVARSCEWLRGWFESVPGLFSMASTRSRTRRIEATAPHVCSEGPPTTARWLRASLQDDFGLNYDRLEDGKSEINRRNRSKLTVYHTTGTKSFARKRHELLGAVQIDEVGPADLYAASHKHKNGEWICDAARMNFVVMTRHLRCSLVILVFVRSHVPFDVVNWSKVSDEVKSYVMNKVLMTSTFNLDYDRPEDRNIVISTMNTAYKTYQNKMHQYYALFPTKEEALEHPYLEHEKGRMALICELFSTEEFQEKMEALQLQHESEGRSFTEVEIFTEVLGTKVGFVRGLGHSVRKVGLSSSVSSIDLARRLEEARMEIEEMRARRKNMMR